MSPSQPTLLPPLPSGWADLAATPAPRTAPAHDIGTAAWFGAPASGRVLSADPHAGHGRDVQAWTDAVLRPLLAGPDAP